MHEPEESRVTHRRLLAGGAAVAAFVGQATGCATFGGGTPDTSEGEAVLAALEHMAARKWEGSSTLVEGKLAVAYDGQNPLSESTRRFLDEVIEVRGWRWSTEDPLVQNGCRHPSLDCRLKDPTELHLTFAVKPWPGEEDYAAGTADSSWSHPAKRFVVEPVPGQEGYKVHVEWLSSLYYERLGRDWAELGGDGLLVTPGPDGWKVERVMWWIT